MRMKLWMYLLRLLFCLVHTHFRGCRENGHFCQYDETNVMHFSFSLLRIKGLYMFRPLLAHPQESLHKRHLVYCVRIMSVGCATFAVKLQWWHSQLTLYAPNVPMLSVQHLLRISSQCSKKCRGPWFSINWMKSASRWFHHTDILGCTVSKTLSWSLIIKKTDYELEIIG
jgi:hypothetical protein